MSNLQVTSTEMIFGSLKIKACDLSQWSPDLENNIAIATKAPVEIEVWGVFPKLVFSNKSWIHFFGENKDNPTSFLHTLEKDGHLALKQHPLSNNALIYNAKKRELIVWRSEIAHPLYWATQKNCLILSNGICGPIQAGWMGLAPNTATIASYLYFGQVPEDSSMVEGLYKLPLYQGIVFKIQTGAIFEFQAPQKKTQDSTDKLLSFSSPLEALWYFQEPRADFFLSFSPLFKEFNKALLMTKPFKAAPDFVTQMAVFFITHFKGTSKWRKWIRSKALRTIYKPLEPLIQWLQNRSIFDYRMISNKMLLGSDLVFCPWNFLQTLSKERFFSHLVDWPQDIAIQFHQLLPFQKPFENVSEDEGEVLIQDNEWMELLGKLRKSSLIEEGIIPQSLLIELEYGLATRPQQSQLQLSTLLALELWLKVFVDHHAQIPTFKNWKSWLN